MPGWSTWLNSITSPVLMSLAALSTLFGPMWLPEPRSSPAPHFEGQRALSGGGIQLGVWATADAAANNAATTMIDPVICPLRFMASSRGSRSDNAGAAPRMRERHGAFKRRLRAAGWEASSANLSEKFRPRADGAQASRQSALPRLRMSAAGLGH